MDLNSQGETGTLSYTHILLKTTLYRINLTLVTTQCPMTIYILVWVDDLTIAASNAEALSRTKKVLAYRFNMKDMGKLIYFLGIDFEQKNNCVYVQKILERFDLINCKPRSTPSEHKFDCPTDNDLTDQRKYREAVERLIYLMVCTRPDICWIVT